MEKGSESFVKVSIFGQEYTVKAKADSHYIADVAQHVDEKMRDVEKSVPSVQSSEKIAILAAMSVTDELFRLRQEKNEIINQIETKASTLIELIDEATVS